jgi:hypothetical protein
LLGEALPVWKQQIVIGLSEALKSRKKCQIVLHTATQARLVKAIIKGINKTFGQDTHQIRVKIAGDRLKKVCQVGSVLYD